MLLLLPQDHTLRTKGLLYWNTCASIFQRCLLLSDSVWKCVLKWCLVGFLSEALQISLKDTNLSTNSLPTTKAFLEGKVYPCLYKPCFFWYGQTMENHKENLVIIKINGRGHSSLQDTCDWDKETLPILPENLCKPGQQIDFSLPQFL